MEFDYHAYCICRIPESLVESAKLDGAGWLADRMGNYGASGTATVAVIALFYAVLYVEWMV